MGCWNTEGTSMTPIPCFRRFSLFLPSFHAQAMASVLTQSVAAEGDHLPCERRVWTSFRPASAPGETYCSTLWSAVFSSRSLEIVLQALLVPQQIETDCDIRLKQ